MNELFKLLRSSNKREFHAAVDELGAIPSEEGGLILEEMARDPSEELRSRALTAMLKVWPDRAERLATQLLRDPDPMVRVKAIYALRKIDSRPAAPLITKLLSTDPEELVRSWAAFALGQIGDASALPALRAAAERDQGTDHEGRPIRETATNSISMIESRLRGGDSQ